MQKVNFCYKQVQKLLMTDWFVVLARWRCTSPYAFCAYACVSVCVRALCACVYLCMSLPAPSSSASQRCGWRRPGAPRGRLGRPASSHVTTSSAKRRLECKIYLREVCNTFQHSFAFLSGRPLAWVMLRSLDRSHRFDSCAVESCLTNTLAYQCVFLSTVAHISLNPQSTIYSCVCLCYQKADDHRETY
jgi:hypothetical protein